jgi:hypothetical protein
VKYCIVAIGLSWRLFASTMSHSRQAQSILLYLKTVPQTDVPLRKQKALSPSAWIRFCKASL